VKKTRQGKILFCILSFSESSYFSGYLQYLISAKENGRGPGVTPTPEVMAAERSPRVASMSTTQPLIKNW
jgi:hypothetical protein